MTTLLAATPLIAVLVMMGILRRSAAMAGALGLGVALALALTIFRPSGQTLAPTLLTGGGALAEALHSTATILWIILPALALYEFQNRTGAIGRIRDALSGLTDNRRLQAILIAWFFALFIEGVAGFGTPVALAAPLLVGLGYAPIRAVVLALIGHVSAVPFAAVGTPTLAQLELTGLDPQMLSIAIAVLLTAAGPLLLLVMVRLADDGPLTRSDLSWAGLALICFFLPALVLARFAGPELPSLGGALLGVVVFGAVLRMKQPGKTPDMRALLPDLTPYLMIIGFVLVTRLVPQIQAPLRDVQVGWTLMERFSGTFEPLYHPGTLLFAGLILGALVTGRAAHLGGAVASGLKRLAPVALALVMMLALSRIMVHAGMITTLAQAAAQVGTAWPVIAPGLGVLGTFLTGSATASNILFTELQLSTAQALSLPPVIMVAAQGFGAAIGNVLAPHNIIAGSATVGLVGREGDVLAKTALVCLAGLAIGGGLVLTVTLLS